MSSKEEIGIISCEKAVITWKIEDFFSYKEDNSKYWSPKFQLLNSVWQIKIWPNGRASKESTGYVSIYLHRVDNGASKIVEIEFSIKTTNYFNETMPKITWKSDNLGYGFSKFIARTQLQQKKESLVPSGNLTIVCILTEKIHEDFGVVTSKNKLLTDLKDMFILEKSTDVTIKVNEETFSAHRCILAARSPVLAAMFENDMTEKETGFVDIPDCDPKAFRHFLFYLYSGELDSGECDFFHVYKIADKYDVPELKLMCTDLIISSICLENIFETYIFGCQFNENKLLSNVQNFFNENFEKILSLESWESFMKENTSLANNLLKAMDHTVPAKKRKLL